MTRGEKILKEVIKEELSLALLWENNEKLMEEAAWQAWSWMSECASALEGHQYEKEKDREIFETWWNVEID